VSWAGTICLAIRLCTVQYEFHVKHKDWEEASRWYTKTDCERKIASFKATNRERGAQPSCVGRAGLR